MFTIGVVTPDCVVKVQCMSSTSTGGAAFTILNCITTVLLMTSTMSIRSTRTVGGTAKQNKWQATQLGQGLSNLPFSVTTLLTAAGPVPTTVDALTLHV